MTPLWAVWLIGLAVDAALFAAVAWMLGYRWTLVPADYDGVLWRVVLGGLMIVGAVRVASL